MKPRYLSLEPLIPWMSKIHPIEWHKMFVRTGELYLEVGFGTGDFLVRQGKERPERNFVGIELGWPQARRTLRKIALAGVKNVRILLVDARVAVKRLFSEKSLHGVYALFPCPWPKKRHEKHRLFSNNFLRDLNSRLIDKGDVLVVTDEGSYIDWIHTQVPGTGFQARLRTIPPKFQTKYEIKWNGLGRQEFYELRLIKWQHVPNPAREDVTLITHRVGQFDPVHFRPVNERGEIIVEFKETLYDPERRKVMVRSLVVEENFVQNFWIEIVHKEKGWSIRPAKGCGMIPTSGVQRALDLVREAAAQ